MTSLKKKRKKEEEHKVITLLLSAFLKNSNASYHTTIKYSHLHCNSFGLYLHSMVTKSTMASFLVVSLSWALFQKNYCV